MTIVQYTEKVNGDRSELVLTLNDYCSVDVM